jgi:hypothetical protein
MLEYNDTHEHGQWADHVSTQTVSGWNDFTVRVTIRQDRSYPAQSSAKAEVWDRPNLTWRPLDEYPWWMWAIRHPQHDATGMSAGMKAARQQLLERAAELLGEVE